MKKLFFILSVMLMTTNVSADTYITVYNRSTGQYYTLSGSTANNGYSVYKRTTQKKTTIAEPKTEQTTQTVQTTKQNTSAVQNVDVSTAQQILSLVNSQRAANGLSLLTLNTNLSRVAQAKAEDMKNKNYFSHNSPTYGSPFDMMKSFGISYRAAGENIAKGQKTPSAVMTAWMNSSGHRKNILNANYTQLGIGYVYNNGSPYWVQMFIG
ncbi:MAG: hypothetical protein IJR59_05835 [Firmicutes bacterium]|nr:hypothetical protein [Bacillota bacterium]